MSPRPTCLAVAAVLIAAGAASAQFYSLDPSQGLIEGISDTGLAAGSFGVPEYFLWNPAVGTYEFIGGTIPGNGVGGQAKLSKDGSRLSGTAFNPATGYNEMAYYDVAAGAWTLLGGIGGISDAETSSGWNVSGNGQAIVGLGWVDAGTAHAVKWTQGAGVVDLGSTTPGNSSRASAVDYDGNVVAGWQDNANGRQGTVWVDGVQELIFDAGGMPALEAFDVSGDGQWVSGYGIGGFFDPGRAYRYNTVTDAHEYLPLLDGLADSNMGGAGITDDGMTIVGGTWGFGPAFWGNAFIWREGVGTMSMNAYLDSLGIAYPDNFRFAFASAISSDGQWIAGWGDYNDFNTQSWVVHIPAPGSAVLLGLLGAVVRRRR